MKNEKLTQARKNKNLTQEELAKKIPCEKTTISNWENGVSNPNLTVAFKLADLLGQDVNYLFSDLKVQDNHTSLDKQEVIS